MEESLRDLSQHLKEVSSLLSTLVDSGQLRCPNSSNDGNQAAINSSPTSTVRSESQPRSSGSGLSTANIRNRIGSAIAHARSIITSSASTGVYSRLSQRERLRASTSAAIVNQPTSKRKKKDTSPSKKAFEFVLVNASVENESWAITDENTALRGLIEVTTVSKGKEIRAEIGKATRFKYPMVNDGDFEFLRDTRRKLSKPVSCLSYDYEQIKLLAGQGSIYVKLKDGLDCLLVDVPSGDDEGNMFDQLHPHLTFLSIQICF